MCWTASVIADQGYYLSPSSLSLIHDGSPVSGSFEVVSTGNEPVALEISILERRMDIHGFEDRPSAENDFLVYPPQILLQPGDTQAIRLTWLGTADVDFERAYRLIADQLPIKFGNQKNDNRDMVVNINSLFRYVATVYVTPDSAHPEIQLKASHRAVEESDKLVLSFENSGTAHQLLRDLRVTLEAGGKRVSLGPSDMPNVTGQNVLARHKREFLLPWPSQLPVSELEVSFDVRKN